jgi:hydroxymethylpyrimidine pyrophosphatase-like HAD family hydrolase
MTRRADLLLVDADGTLVGPNGVPPSAWAAVARGRAAGLRFALCTGRGGRGSVLELAARLDAEGPHAVDAGAAVVFASGRTLHLESLDEAQLDCVTRAAAVGGHVLEIYGADGGFHSPDDGPGLRAHASLLGAPLLAWPSPTPGAVVRAQLLVEPGADFSKARALIEASGALEVHVGTSPRMPGYRFVGVTGAGVSKLSAAHRIAAWYGVTMDRTAMVGDGDNDAGVMAGVGLGIAMGNATSATRAAAGHLVAPVEAGGFAEAVDWLLTAP